jgi:hypothetical protein
MKASALSGYDTDAATFAPDAILLMSARAYIDGARLMVENPAFGRSDLNYLPLYSVISNALELCLKAMLALHGTSEKDLKFKYGHKLKLAFEDAQGFGLEPDDAGYLVDKLHPLHSEHRLRYLQPGKIGVGDIDRAFAILEALYERVRVHVAAAGALVEQYVE